MLNQLMVLNSVAMSQPEYEPFRGDPEWPPSKLPIPDLPDVGDPPRLIPPLKDPPPSAPEPSPPQAPPVKFWLSSELLQQELRAATRAGLSHIELLPNCPLIACETAPCLRFPRQGQFHPLKYLAGLFLPQIEFALLSTNVSFFRNFRGCNEFIYQA